MAEPRSKGQVTGQGNLRGGMVAGAGEQKQGQEMWASKAIGVKPEGAGQSEGASGKAWDSKGPSTTAGATMNKINWHAQRCARR